ncbi:hypothetical protein CRD60_06665 [Bifidobacterium aemilianum]|uniref:Uncharacterized protein n=1 Tax=Bifidobacterium aemilianum TaxID=2493120 RepID=A0A366K806_9BIFI|nr:hypothetical protein CRD60_06665 [Bifidobacterium aemilianum]
MSFRSFSAIGGQQEQGKPMPSQPHSGFLARSESTMSAYSTERHSSRVSYINLLTKFPLTPQKEQISIIIIAGSSFAQRGRQTQE